MVLAERLRAQLLSGPPASSPAAVAERLLAVQAQDPRGFRLAVRARTAGLTAADVDRALDSAELVVSWLNRGTLHLVRREDHEWLRVLTAPRHERAVLRRLAQEGVGDPEAAARRALHALGADGPLSRAQLGERLGLRGQALIHVLCLACLRGRAVRGRVRSGEQAYVRVEPPAPVDRDRALAELARRYLAGHGPATDRDLARWAGVGLREARAGLGAISVVERADGLLALEPPARVELPPPRLLGAFEPVLLGWASRDLIEGAERVVSGGVFRAFALVGGRVAGTWRVRGGAVEFDGPWSAELRAEAADVERFLAAPADVNGSH